MATSPGYGERYVLRGLINRETEKGESCSPGSGRLSPVAALVHRHDHDRFQTALFAPAPRREALFALYAFNYEIARVRETVSEPMLGQIRLQWWRESITAAFEGGPVRRHIVVEPLTAAIRAHGLTRAHFDRLIDAREGDLGEAPIAALSAACGPSACSGQDRGGSFTPSRAGAGPALRRSAFGAPRAAPGHRRRALAQADGASGFRPVRQGADSPG